MKKNGNYRKTKKSKALFYRTAENKKGIAISSGRNSKLPHFKGASLKNQKILRVIMKDMRK